MMECCGRIYFAQNPPGDVGHVWGKIYDQAKDQSLELAALDLARNPALLNHREADLAVVAYLADRHCWRLVRDFGQTPLYYALIPGGFVWSFTYRGLLDLLDDPQPDEATLFDYLATHYRHIFRDPARTFHQGVRQVPAGAYVDLSAGGSETTVWLDLTPGEVPLGWGPEEYTDRLMELLRESIRLRVMGADRPAFTVSSGLDSSTVAVMASEYLGPIDVFSVGYGGYGTEEYDETAGVAALTAGRDWRWTQLHLESPDLLSETAGLIRLTGSPVVTATWLSYYLMARQLEGYGDIFNGIGGDECLAGEYAHFLYFFADLKQAGLLDRLDDEVAAWSRLHDHPVFKKNAGVLHKFWQDNLDFTTGSMLAPKEIYQANWRFFDPDWLKRHGSVEPPMPRPFEGFLANRLFQEWSFETTPPTLWGLFMANQALGLRGVAPFLSPKLFRFCLAVPGTVKYDRGLTKALLRRGLGGILPDSLRWNHRKVGFNAPINQWFCESRTADNLLEMLLSGPVAKKGWLRPGAAEQIFKEHKSGQANHMMLLWPLLNVSLFLD